MVEVVQGNPKILHLQYGSRSSGNYTIRLHEAFLDFGIDSKVLSLYSNITGDDRVQSLGKLAHYKSRINQELQDVLIKGKNKNYGGFSCSIIGSDITSHPLVKEADVIYVHWVLGGFLSVRNLQQLAALGKHIIMVMHDMWSITGGCSHSFDCQKFYEGCYNCPILPGEKHNDISARQFRTKQKFYTRFENLDFIAPSRWLYNLAKDAALTRTKPVHHIPNVIDTSIFKPFEKKIAKKILNINENSHVIAFGANRINSPYKGWAYLQKALDQLKLKNEISNIEVLVFGSGVDKQLEQEIPFKSSFMGYIEEDFMLNLIYNASDVFVVPSLADNLPTTILESINCATPVVGFDVGGIPDMILHKENGYLARYKDDIDLADGIIYCLTHQMDVKLPEMFSRDAIIRRHKNMLSAITKNPS